MDKKPGRPKKPDALTPAQKQAAYRARQSDFKRSSIPYAVYRDFMDAQIKEWEDIYRNTPQAEQPAIMDRLNMLVVFDMKFKRFLREKNPAQDFA